jgi:LysR family transcriptional regulator, glycine cleavage system transcriptional activator
VTPSALSQLLKGLESELGTPLFRRDNRAIALTEAAQALLPPVRNAFRLIADASDRARGDPHGGFLTIGVTAFSPKTGWYRGLGAARRADAGALL